MYRMKPALRPMEIRRRWCDHLPSKQAVAGWHPQDWLLAFSSAGRSGPGVPPLPSWRLPRGFPPFCHVPPSSELATSCWKAPCRLVLAVHEENGSRVTGCGHPWCPTRWEPPRFCLECRCRAWANPRSVLLAAFSRPLSRSSPLLDRPPRLGLWCAEETSSTHWTIGVPYLHLLTRHREEASKERSMGLCASHASKSSLDARTSSCLGRRNRTCIVTLLTAHAASGHEAGGDGSFRERPQRRLPLEAAVPVWITHIITSWFTSHRSLSSGQCYN
jgi:hypothetical protein